MSGPKGEERVRALHLLANFFDLPPTELLVLENLLDDEACWLVGGDLPGTRVIRLPSPEADRVTVYLSRARAGGHLPLHHHRGRESVLVLRGGFSEQGGRHAGPGEVMVSEPGTEHAIEIDPDMDCVCAIRVDFVGLDKASHLDTGIFTGLVADPPRRR